MTGRRGSRAILARHVRRLCAVTLVLWGAGAHVPAVTGDDQSLADVARAEAERRQAILRPARLYTNKDLGPVAPPGPAAPGEEAVRVDPGPEQGGAAGSTPEGPGDGAGREEPVADQRRWRQRLSEAREALARSRTLAETLQSHLNALTADFAARDDPAQRGRIASDLQQARAELDRVRAEAEAHQAAIAEIEEDARRAGIPPGWVR